MIKDKEYYIQNLKVLYEDNHILVIEKPENVLSQKDETDDFDINEIVKEYLKRKYNKPGNVYLGLVHRLDRRVGGVMVLAKTSKAASRLSVMIEQHQFEKHYIACVNGYLDESGSINIKIKKEKRMAVISNDGKDSSLDYETINAFEEKSYVNVNLHSGRYNQIRVSFASIDHPIVGDYKYGAKNEERLGLWCYSIKFIHPVSKEDIVIKDIPNGKPWEKLNISNL